MKSVMKHQFSEVPKATIPRSSFDRSHGFKTTFDAAGLVPFFVDEALPGDTFNLKTSGFARMATPIHPVMDNLYMETFYFAVPIRLIWDNFRKMMGEQDTPAGSTDFLTPQVTVTPTEQSIYDYWGWPVGVEVTASALYQRAYFLIWNQWFRDQNLQGSFNVPTDDGPDQPPADMNPYMRGKRHDYFTSSLPFPQKGPDILLPLGTTAPVTSNLQTPLASAPGSGGGVFDRNLRMDGATTQIQYDGPAITDSGDMVWGNETGMVTDLSNATAATINQLRQAFQVQKMYEKDARGGTRYTEVIRSHFGVTSPDARLQRPEYLGGGRTHVNITPVAATNRLEQTTTQSLGELGGYGTASLNGHGFTKSFTEHCILMGFVNVRSDITYQQGLDRQFSRRDRLDFFWPSLAFLGEQEVLNKEIFYDPVDGLNDDVWGYQERFAEYRYKPSRITGKFRSTAAQSLDSWHLGLDFETRPTLSPQFIKDDPPIDRVIAVPDEPHFIADFYHKLKCARPMPLYGVPGNIDRF